VAPDVLFGCTYCRWASLGVAWHLSLLAPRLAHQDTVSFRWCSDVAPAADQPYDCGTWEPLSRSVTESA